MHLITTHLVITKQVPTKTMKHLRLINTGAVVAYNRYTPDIITILLILASGIGIGFVFSGIHF